MPWEDIQRAMERLVLPTSGRMLDDDKYKRFFDDLKECEKALTKKNSLEYPDERLSLIHI
eukprot:8665905-Prorocentrum_lima.AAC.1